MADSCRPRPRDPKSKQISFVARCPHCDQWMEIIQLNCKIFRHGNLPPHSKKQVCDRYRDNPRLPGCGGPFRVVEAKDGELSVVPCDYI